MSWPAQYVCAPGLGATQGSYALRPIDWADREAVREWRNAQLDVLRQRDRLSVEDQDRYYREVVEPQMALAAPPQVLLAMTADGRLVGYGGVVHISWPDLRGEVSFLTDSTRLDADTFATDWRAYLAMLVPIARDQLELRELTTEAFPQRQRLFPLLEEAGFIRQPDQPDGMVRHVLQL